MSKNYDWVSCDTESHLSLSRHRFFFLSFLPHFLPVDLTTKSAAQFNQLKEKRKKKVIGFGVTQNLVPLQYSDSSLFFFSSPTPDITLNNSVPFCVCVCVCFLSSFVFFEFFLDDILSG